MLIGLGDPVITIDNARKAQQALQTSHAAQVQSSYLANRPAVTPDTGLPMGPATTIYSAPQPQPQQSPVSQAPMTGLQLALKNYANPTQAQINAAQAVLSGQVYEGDTRTITAPVIVRQQYCGPGCMQFWDINGNMTQTGKTPEEWAAGS